MTGKKRQNDRKKGQSDPFCHQVLLHNYIEEEVGKKRVRVTLFVTLFLLVTLRRSRRVSFGDSSPSLKLRVRMTEKALRKEGILRLLTLPQTLSWAEALSRCPELMRRVCEGAAKGLRRDDKITRKEISIGNFKEIPATW